MANLSYAQTPVSVVTAAQVEMEARRKRRRRSRR